MTLTVCNLNYTCWKRMRKCLFEYILSSGGDVVVPTARCPVRGQALQYVHRHVVGRLHICWFTVTFCHINTPATLRQNVTWLCCMITMSGFGLFDIKPIYPSVNFYVICTQYTYVHTTRIQLIRHVSIMCDMVMFAQSWQTPGDRSFRATTRKTSWSASSSCWARPPTTRGPASRSCPSSRSLHSGARSLTQCRTRTMHCHCSGYKFTLQFVF